MHRLDIVAFTSEQRGYLVVQILVDLQPHQAASGRIRRKGDHGLTGQLGRVLNGGLDVFTLEVVAAHDFVGGLAGREVVENDRYHDARSPDAGFAVTDRRVDRDAILPIHASRLRKALNPS
jgi:hypothetical protein